MAVTYLKSLSADFSGNLNPSQLFDEIQDAFGIIPICITVTNIGNDVRILFESSLSSGEQVTLDNLISVHSPAAYIGQRIINIPLQNTLTDRSTYTTLNTIVFAGYMEQDGTSFDVRIYDTTNINDICSITLSNELEGIIDFGLLSNLPTGEAMFECQARVDGTSVAHIKNIILYHD
jgi:hypothetical protein